MAIPIERFPKWIQQTVLQMRDNVAGIQTRAAIDIGDELLQHSPVRTGNFQHGWNLESSRSAALRYRETTADSRGNVRGVNYATTIAK